MIWHLPQVHFLTTLDRVNNLNRYLINKGKGLGNFSNIKYNTMVIDNFLSYVEGILNVDIHFIYQIFDT